MRWCWSLGSRGGVGCGIRIGNGSGSGCVATLLASAQGGLVALAVEGCTGWRYVVEEITAAGFEAHVAETADTKQARSRKHRAKTDRTDARLLRELLQCGELPESWIPPTDVLEWRERVRLYKSLVDQRTKWCQRIHAELFQHGVSVPEGAIRSAAVRARIADKDVQLSPAARQRIRVGYQMIDATDCEAMPLKQALTALRDTPAGVSGVGRRAVRDRWPVGRSGVVRARRLPTVLSLETSRTSHGSGCDGGCVESTSRGRISGSPGSRDVAVGVVRSCEELITSTQSRPCLLRATQGPSRRQDRRDLNRTSVHTTLLPHLAQSRSRDRVRHADLTLTAIDGAGRLFAHQGRPRSAPEEWCPPALVLDGL